MGLLLNLFKLFLMCLKGQFWVRYFFLFILTVLPYLTSLVTLCCTLMISFCTCRLLMIPIVLPFSQIFLTGPHANLMSFNSSKCKYMIISRKKSHHVASAFLGGQVLELVDHYKYLGFHLSADLLWSYHIQCICNKARKINGILYRQFSSNVDSPVKTYTSLVRPHLEYGIKVWNPYLIFFPLSHLLRD